MDFCETLEHVIHELAHVISDLGGFKSRSAASEADFLSRMPLTGLRLEDVKRRSKR